MTVPMKTPFSLQRSVFVTLCMLVIALPVASAQAQQGVTQAPAPATGDKSTSGDKKAEEEKKKKKAKKEAEKKREKVKKEADKKREKAEKEAKKKREKAEKKAKEKREKAEKEAKKKREKAIKEAEKKRKAEKERAEKEAEKKRKAKKELEEKERKRKVEKERKRQAEKEAEKKRKAKKEPEETERKRKAEKDKEKKRKAKKEREEQERRRKRRAEEDRQRRFDEAEREAEERDGRRARERERRDRDDRQRDRFGDRREERRDARRDRRETNARELARTRIKEGEKAIIDGGARYIERRGGRVIIRHDDSKRFRTSPARREVHRLPNGRQRIVRIRPDGVRIITIRERNGDIVLRRRVLPDGRKFVLIDNRRFRRDDRHIDLGPLRIKIPRHKYIVDAHRASRRDLELALTAPPVEPVKRYYTLDEVRRFDRLRDKMRRVDLTSITFATDSAWIEERAIDALAEVASILNSIIVRNPGEMFLIAGHTDLVGSDIYNLALSDRRAEAVAIALTGYFGVPPENLVTQGYGEQFPVIPTEFAERANRRVSVRRITPLLWTSRR